MTVTNTMVEALQEQLGKDGVYVGDKTCLRALIAALGAEPREPVAQYRHKKRGTIYELIGIGRMQAENWEEREYAAADEPVHGASVDMREVAVYRSIDNGAIWVRPMEEFKDGRFEPVAALTGGADGK